MQIYEVRTSVQNDKVSRSKVSSGSGFTAKLLLSESLPDLRVLRMSESKLSCLVLLWQVDDAKDGYDESAIVSKVSGILCRPARLVYWLCQLALPQSPACQRLLR